MLSATCLCTITRWFSRVVFAVISIFSLNIIFGNKVKKKNPTLRGYFLHVNNSIWKFQREGWKLLTQKRETGKKIRNRANLPKALSRRNTFWVTTLETTQTQSTNVNKKISKERSGIWGVLKLYEEDFIYTHIHKQYLISRKHFGK